MSIHFSIEPARETIFPLDWQPTPVAFGENLQQAIEYLTFRVENLNAAAACERIEKFVADQQKYRLFQKYFPLEWERSGSSFYKAGFYENYTERTNEFFDLVHQHLFSLLSGWNEDPDTDFESFSLFSLNVDFCCDDIEYEYLRVSYAAGLLFFVESDELWEYFSHEFNVRPEDLPEINRTCCRSIWELPKVGREGLYLNIFEVIDHSTGNPWLDTSNCNTHETYSWEEQTIQILTDSFREANERLGQTELLDKLIEANPKETLLEMIMLWNTGKMSSRGE